MSLPFRAALFGALLSTAFCLSTRALSLNFSNSNPVIVNDSGSPPTKAAPYPSSLTVTGVTGQVITKATVTLKGFTHGFPSDVTMLLVAPAGQKLILLSEVG